jgi:hypothetical protein
MSCKQLVIKEEMIPATCKAFRPKFLPDKIVAQGELVTKLEEAGFTGLYFTDTSEFIGL